MIQQMDEDAHAGTSLDPLRGPSVAEMPWLRGYRDVVEVFRSKDFVQGGGGRRDSAPITGYGVLALSGRDHLERRKIESVLFRRGMLERLEKDVVAPSFRAELDRLRATDRDSEGAVGTDLLGFLRGVFCELTCAFWGIDGVDTPAQRQAFLDTVERVIPGGAVEWEKTSHRAVLRESLRARAEFVRQYLRPSWAARAALVAAAAEGRLAESELPTDMITTMLRNRPHFDRWDEDVFVRELILYAPGDTIVRVVPHMVEEMIRWLRAHPDDRRMLADVAFLRRCAAESLRLHPASPYFIRQAVRDTELASGRRFAAGEYVVLDVKRASRDPEVFGADAEEFRPHRRPGPKVKPTGIAFGDGPHTCIGAALSLGEVTGRPSDPGGPVGLIPFTLRELWRAGVTPDTAAGASRNEVNVRDEYLSYPVRFTAL